VSASTTPIRRMAQYRKAYRRVHGRSIQIQYVPRWYYIRSGNCETRHSSSDVDYFTGFLTRRHQEMGK
jgi:hypothetical protein